MPPHTASIETDTVDEFALAERGVGVQLQQD